MSNKIQVKNSFRNINAISALKTCLKKIDKATKELQQIQIEHTQFYQQTKNLPLTSIQMQKLERFYQNSEKLQEQINNYHNAYNHFSSKLAESTS